MRALLLSNYELGHQPLSLAAATSALQRAGHQVRSLDLSVQELDRDSLRWADGVALSVPMHTALRLARTTVAEMRATRPDLAVCFFGLYATVDDGNEETPVDLAVAGEYEPALVEFFDSLSPSSAPDQAARAGVGPSVRVELARGPSHLPDRRQLAPLESYARLLVGEESRLAGYTEASRGCVHRCRHCPVPVVYDGRTRVVAVDTVLADVAQLVALGAQHITFGDPDFLNGPHHARRVVRAVHGAFPHLTFDVTAKVSHVLAHAEVWPELAAAGCLFVVSAFESASDHVLARLDKGHTVADEVEAVRVLRSAGIEPRPSLLPFTPWTTDDDVRALLDLVAHCDLVGNVDPVQYSIRLLVPPGSLLLDSGDLDGLLGAYDPERLGWTWTSPDPRLDALQRQLSAWAEVAGGQDWDPVSTYDAVRALSAEALGPALGTSATPAPDPALLSSIDVGRRPRLSEPWFCCAEPTSSQLDAAGRSPSLATGGR